MNAQPIDRRAIPADAILSDWAAPDGWRYRRMDWPQPPGASPRGSLLFAGGRGDFIEKYLEAQAAWHARGWNLTTFDWRGQGASQGEGKGGHLDSLEPLVGDLAALIEQWRAATPPPHVVVAHSMGGHVLLRVLTGGRAAIDAAVLVAPMVEVNSGPVPAWGASALATFLSSAGWGKQPVWQQRAFSRSAGSTRQNILTGSRERYEDELWWWDQQPDYCLGAPSWGWLGAAYRSSALLTPQHLRAIGTPCLFIGTERDRLVDPAAIKRAASLVPGAELLMFPAAGHEILREADTVRLAALERIDGFLAARAPR